MYCKFAVIVYFTPSFSPLRAGGDAECRETEGVNNHHIILDITLAKSK